MKIMRHMIERTGIVLFFMGLFGALLPDADVTTRMFIAAVGGALFIADPLFPVDNEDTTP